MVELAVEDTAIEEDRDGVTVMAATDSSFEDFSLERSTAGRAEKAGQSGLQWGGSDQIPSEAGDLKYVSQLR